MDKYLQEIVSERTVMKDLQDKPMQSDFNMLGKNLKIAEVTARIEKSGAPVTVTLDLVLVNRFCLG